MRQLHEPGRPAGGEPLGQTLWQPAWIQFPVERQLYRRCLAVLLAGYAGVFGWLLAAADFLPYVMDNNETFSSIIHAKSMYYFGFAESFGLTDESYGITAASHPFVYTHQGNFPRFPALLLYALGATSAQSQILIHTVTIGLASVVLAYHFFSRHARPVFALVACLVLMTDYIFFVQWNVNTWRVWHTFFLFGGLLCVEGLADPRTGWRYAACAFVLWACLYYYEFIYAAFISATVGLYAIYYHRKRLRTILLAGAVLLSGALTSVSILIAQAVAFYGWDDFVEDATLTFVARNWAPDVKSYLAQLEAFFGERNLVFWYNVVDSSASRGLVYFFGSLSWNYFSVYTPFMTIAALMLAAGWCASVARGSVASARRRGLRSRPADPAPVVEAVAIVLAGSAVLAAALALGINATVNVGPKVAWPFLAIGLLAVIGLVRFDALASAISGAARSGDLRSPAGLRGIRFAAIASVILSAAAVPSLLPLPLNINGTVRASATLASSALLALMMLFVSVAAFPRVVDLLARALARQDRVKAARGTVRLVLALIALAGMSAAALMSALMIASRPNLPMATLGMGLAAGLAALVVAVIWWRPLPRAALAASPAADAHGGSAGAVVVTAALALAALWIVYALSGAPGGDAVALAGGVLAAAALLRWGLGWGPGRLARTSIDALMSSVEARRALMTFLVLVAAMLPLLALHRSLSGGYFGRYSTGYFALFAATAAMGAVLAFAVLVSRWRERRPEAGQFLIGIVRYGLSFWPALLLVVYVAAAWRFARLVMVDDRSLGLNPATFPVVNDPWNLWFAIAASTACLVLVPALAMRTGSRLRRGDVFGPIAGIAFLLAFHGFIGLFYQVYDPRLVPIWTAYSGSFQPFMKALIVLVASLSISLMMRRPARLLGAIAAGGVRNLVILVACAFVGYTIVYNLSPGYVLTGYLHRAVPFASYFVQIMLAFAACSLLFLGRIELRRIFARYRQPFARMRSVRSAALGSLSLACVVVLSIYWLGLQHFYYRHLPPDHFAFLEKLELPPFKGKSFVVDNYAAPVAVATGQWAYFDSRIANALFTDAADGPRIVHDPWTYLWLADKRVNDTYKRPDYFMCISTQNLLTVAARLSGNWGGFGNVPVGCSSVNLVRSLIEGNDMPMQNTLVARDDSSRDRWAIVALNWDIPPAVEAPDDRRAAPIGLNIERQGRMTWLTPTYRLRGAAEDEARPPLLSLYRVGQPDGGCGGPEKPDALMGEVEGSRIALPDGFRGRLRVGLRPRAGPRVGAEALSAIYQVEQGVPGRAGTIVRCAPQLPRSPAAVTIKRSAEGSMVVLGWTPVDHAASYEVEMQSNQGEFVQIARLENWKLEHKVNDLAPKGHYCFSVRACSTVGCSPSSLAVAHGGSAGAACPGPLTAARPAPDRPRVERSD